MDAWMAYLGLSCREHQAGIVSVEVALKYNRNEEDEKSSKSRRKIKAFC